MLLIYFVFAKLIKDLCVCVSHEALIIAFSFIPFSVHHTARPISFHTNFLFKKIRTNDDIIIYM